MTRRRLRNAVVGVATAVTVLAAGWFAASDDGALGLIATAEAAGGKIPGPNATAPDRYVYYPGTEKLDPDEMRVTACGTGMPAARRGQAATCFLVELGNGEKFLFDIGTGSMSNIAAYMIPYDYLDKVFISHLHTDHFGDLSVLWAGGWTSGRTGPLRVWGPSGATPEMGTKAAIEGFFKHYQWDYKSREAVLNPTPGQIEVNEFDYMGINEIVYQENGVTIRSQPAIHIADGPVSFTLEWNGYKFVFGGDNVPNKWFAEHAKNADLVIHECFPTPEILVQYYGQAPTVALRVGTRIHTSPPAFGKIMSTIKPRHAVAYHFFNEEGTRYQMYDAVRQTYDGPLSMATDNMVWNIRRDEIVERMAVITDDAWSVASLEPPPARTTPPVNMYSKEVLDGVWDIRESEQKLLQDHADKYGIDLKTFK